jgi:predicted restriction endonuclease
MAIWRDDLTAALETLGGQGSLEQIYQAVQTIREKMPPSWQAIVRRELEYNSSDSVSFQKRHDLFYSVDGIGKGLWGLRQKEATPKAADIEQPPPRAKTEIYRILRDTKLARAIKRLHKDKCQICGFTVRTSDGATYSEAHHIKPLGTPHSGPDVKDNILVLCPNHHALIDLGGIALSLSEISSHPEHMINSTYIDYHNEVIVPLLLETRSS